MVVKLFNGRGYVERLNQRQATRLCTLHHRLISQRSKPPNLISELGVNQQSLDVESAEHGHGKIPLQ